MDKQTKYDREWMKNFQRKWRKDNVEKVRAYDREWKRQYQLKYPDKARGKRRERYHREKKNPDWLEKHRAYMRGYHRKWRALRKDDTEYIKKRREQAKRIYQKNGKKIRERRMSKIQERIASNIRSRIISALKGISKSAKTEKLLGITIKELKTYLEGKFQQGMTWGNYGFYGWHCDHIIPLASFDLTNPEEQRKAFHYTNLQPLWAKDNLHKHSKIS